jgi:hypothetical protein
MDEDVKRLQQGLIEVEIEAERLLLARQEVISTLGIQNWSALNFHIPDLCYILFLVETVG